MSDTLEFIRTTCSVEFTSSLSPRYHPPGLQQGNSSSLASLSGDIRISCLYRGFSTSVEKPLQIDYFLCKTNPIFLDFNKKTMMSPKNKPNSNPIQTQFTKRPKMMQTQYLQRIKKKNADWLYSKQSQFKPKQSQFLSELKNALKIHRFSINCPIVYMICWNYL
jgi:hypothetical protein